MPRALVVTTAIVVVVLAVDVLSGGAMRSFTRSSSAVVWRSVATASEHVRVWNVFETRTNLVAENRRLSDELAELRALRFENDIVRAENAALREMLNMSDSEETVATARVLSRPHTSPYGTMVIGAGERDGVAPGDYVLAPGRIALGRIVSVDSETAIAELLLKSGDTINALIDDTPVTLEGQGMSARAEVPRSITIEVGSPVVMPDTGFGVGVVRHVESNPPDATQEIFVGFPINTASLRFVRIITL